jgi:hypothetical protein
MIRRIRRFYPVPTEIARHHGQFAGRWSSTIAETRPQTGYRAPPCDPFFAIIWLQRGFPEQGMAGR